MLKDLDANNYSGNFIEYLLERDDVKPAWHEYTHHDFCVKMGDGTLPRETFKNYMIQDYLYLVCRFPNLFSGVLPLTTTDTICPGQRFGELQIHIS